MTFWNYRIVRHRGSPEWFGVHEAYYNDDGNPIMMTEPVTFSCDQEEGPEGLVRSLEQALADARNRPVLHEDEIKSPGPTNARIDAGGAMEIIDGINDFASDDPRSPTGIVRASDISVLIATLEDEYSLPGRAAGPLSTSWNGRRSKGA